MMYQYLQIATMFIVCTLCGCSESTLTDKQYLEKWRQSELKHSPLHDGGTWHFEFETVRLFRINWDDEHSWSNIFENDRLNETRLPTDGILLNELQVSQLEAAVTGSHPDRGFGACLYPHHAFVFYDKDDKIVGSINVCFLCGSFRADPPGYASNWDLLSLADLIHHAGVPLRNPDWE